MRGAVNSPNGKGWPHKAQNETDTRGPAGHVGILSPHECVGGVGFGKSRNAYHDDEPYGHIDKHYNDQSALAPINLIDRQDTRPTLVYKGNILLPNWTNDAVDQVSTTNTTKTCHCWLLYVGCHS